MGTSYSYSMPVTKMVSDKIPVTLTLTLMSFAMMVLISIPLGLYTAKHEGGTADHVVLALNQIIMAVPPFFSGILITLLFGLILHLFTPGGYVSYTKIPAFATSFSGAGHCPPKAAMAVALRSSIV
ncbi:MAG: ABC transporter permease subunit [Eisenbergiella massiliensis]